MMTSPTAAEIAESAGEQGPSWRPRSIVDWLFMLIPTWAAVGSAFGSTAIAGVTIYPFKVLVLVLAGVILTQHRRLPPAGLPVMALTWCLASWAVLSTAWSPAGTDALTEASIFIFLVALMMMSLKSIGTNWFASLVFGWPIAIVVTVSVAVWELTSGRHLPSRFVDDAALYVEGIPLATFGNPNNFGAFLALAIVMCLVGSTMRELFGDGTRRGMLAAAGVAGIMLPLTASRLAVVGIVVGLITYCLFGLRVRRGQRFALITVAVAVPLAAAVVQVSPALIGKFGAIAAQTTGRGNSTSIRENLILNGWQFFVETRGLGVGAAGYESRIVSGQFDHDLYGRATNPHNLWVELLSQYGIVGIAAVALILAIALRSAAPLRRPSRFGVAYMTGFVVYVLAAMTASSYVNEPVSWTFFASFVAIGVWAGQSRSRNA